MSTRSRVLAFGSAAALVVAGILCAVLVGGLTGQVLTIVLLSLGLGGAVLLGFLEIGLGEERALARAERERERARNRLTHRPESRLGRFPRRRS